MKSSRRRQSIESREENFFLSQMFFYLEHRSSLSSAIRQTHAPRGRYFNRLSHCQQLLVYDWSNACQSSLAASHNRLADESWNASGAEVCCVAIIIFRDNLGVFTVFCSVFQWKIISSRQSGAYFRVLKKSGQRAENLFIMQILFTFLFYNSAHPFHCLFSQSERG